MCSKTIKAPPSTAAQSRSETIKAPPQRRLRVTGDYKTTPRRLSVQPLSALCDPAARSRAEDYNPPPSVVCVRPRDDDSSLQGQNRNVDYFGVQGFLVSKVPNPRCSHALAAVPEDLADKKNTNTGGTIRLNPAKMEKVNRKGMGKGSEMGNKASQRVKSNQEKNEQRSTRQRAPCSPAEGSKWGDGATRALCTVLCLFFTTGVRK